MDEQLLTEVEAAQLIGKSMRTLQQDRWEMKGLPYVKIGGSIRYRLTDLTNSINKQKKWNNRNAAIKRRHQKRRKNQRFVSPKSKNRKWRGGKNEEI
jgi:hypothetical protein